MKLGIMSDGHDNMPLIGEVVKPFDRENVDLVLHAGDFVLPFTADKLKELRARFIGVFGNNDGDKLFRTKRLQEVGELYEECWESELDGKKIIMFHKPDLPGRLSPPVSMTLLFTVTLISWISARHQKAGW